MTIEIVTAFYGDRYRRMMFDTLLPSLWLPDNIPALQSDGAHIEHHVYCTAGDAAFIPQPGYGGSELCVHVLLQDTHSDVQKRNQLHLAYMESIRRERLTVIAPPDHVFGHGLATAISDLKPGELIVCGHPRIGYETGYNRMREFLAEELHSPDASNCRFVRICLDEVPHPMVVHGMANPEPYWRTTQRADHWETYFKEPPPLAWFGHPDLLKSWEHAGHGTLEVLDHELVDDCLKRGMLKVINDSRRFFWAEFTSEKIYLPTIYNNIWLDACKHLNTVPLRWYF